MIAFLLLETLMLGVFCALDLVLFYLFFEGGLIPMFLIIGIWGGKERIYASFKFFLYTFLRVGPDAGRDDRDVRGCRHHGYRALCCAITSRPKCSRSGASDSRRHADAAVGWPFSRRFAVKMPMWPVHTWLPDAHVQAPTAGSVVLAAILLKMGGYGFLRFSLPMFPVARIYCQPSYCG